MVWGNTRNKVKPAHFVRNNGFTRPLNKNQVLVWVFVLFFGLISFGIEIISLDPSGLIPCYVVIGTMHFLLISNIIVLTAIDPSDEFSLQARKEKRKYMEFDREKHKHVIESGYCHICETKVREHSKHCRPCNKCVSRFDHHCIWLNNCIGKKNYRLFLSLLVIVFIGGLMQLTVGSFVFISGFLENNFLNEDVWWRQTTGGFIVVQTIIAFKNMALLVILGLVAQLGGFHMYLIRTGRTTYSHFKLQEEKRNERSKTRESENESGQETTQVEQYFHDNPCPTELAGDDVELDPGKGDLPEVRVENTNFYNINMSFTTDA